MNQPVPNQPSLGLSAPLDWFTLSSPINRARYTQVGFGLGIVKYAIEFAVVWSLTGQRFTPLDFVNPWLSSRSAFLSESPELGIAWLIFTIPFVWIAIAMSVRRAADAGVTPWIGLSMLIPLVNLPAMGVLAVLPSGWLRMSQAELEAEQKRIQETASAFQPPREPSLLPASHISDRYLHALLVGCAVQVGIGMISVWLLHLYGFILFFSAPVVSGAVTGFIYNTNCQRPKRNLFGLILISNIFSFVVMLCLGLDGAICLLMAFPLLAPLSFLGGLIGFAIAIAGLRPGKDERYGMWGAIILLPLCLLLEPFDDHRPLHQVTTSVDIDAPVEVVWQNVIAFPEIDAPQQWFFRLGIAAPIRARIDGHGVGATRYCEFTTGAFVEPIRVWKDNVHLAFDVVKQPMPMKEWTPFSHLHPPHLDQGFVSRKGEFRLESLANGKTRLHGSTWFDIDVRPRLYWKAWADPTIHAIHRRVLDHIAKESEAASEMQREP